MKIELYEKEIDVKTYVDQFVNVEEFLEMCKACPNYDTKWSCPSFDFDPLEFWNQYDKLTIVGRKINLEEEEKEDYREIMRKVKGEMSEELFDRERENPGSMSLSAGTCEICGQGNCTKKIGEPCRFPDKMRYSIEAIGGNVGLTVSKLLGIQLQWITEGQIPDYFVLVGGLLTRNVGNTI